MTRPYRRHAPGEVFGSLTLVEHAGRRNGNGYWRCQCACGRLVEAQIGQLTTGQTVGCGKGACNPAWVAEPTYLGAHGRLWRDRGKASAHNCVDCDATAAEWSYDHADPDELVENSGPRAGWPYSLKSEHYHPRCLPCHRALDRALSDRKAS